MKSNKQIKKMKRQRTNAGKHRIQQPLETNDVSMEAMKYGFPRRGPDWAGAVVFKGKFGWKNIWIESQTLSRAYPARLQSHVLFKKLRRMGFIQMCQTKITFVAKRFREEERMI